MTPETLMLRFMFPFSTFQMAECKQQEQDLRFRYLNKLSKKFEIKNFPQIYTLAIRVDSVGRG